MKKFHLFILSIFTFLLLYQSPVNAQNSEDFQREDSAWRYDPGPLVSSSNPEIQERAQELVDLTAAIPNMPEVSNYIMGDSRGAQKFRPAFGPTPWRMRQEPNSVKILFIGQDGTHIAEAAGRPATAGFGGRAQDLAAYFGVNEGAAFINTYSFTIKGQYSIYQSPYVENIRGVDQIRFQTFVPNNLWQMSMNQSSPITKWRNDLIDWIIRNNRESLKLIVVFGKGANDSIATYIEAKGGDVEGRYEYKMDRIQMPLSKPVSAGSNNQASILLNTRGRDLSEEILGRDIDYSERNEVAAYQAELQERYEEFMGRMLFSKAGPYENGMVDAAQLGGFDLSRISFNGRERTRSLRGLELNDGNIVENDLLVVELPHPTYLSRVQMDGNPNTNASDLVASKLRALETYREEGWTIEADDGMQNQYDEGLAYRYGRADIGPEFYDFGTPRSRMVSRSSAYRKKAHIVIFGARHEASRSFDSDQLDEMTDARVLREDYFPRSELFVARPRTEVLRNVFDAGPVDANGDRFRYAKIMKRNLNLEEVFRMKDGTLWDSSSSNHRRNSIDNYNIKSHPINGDFGHYRGTFVNPRVVILADPQGFDDLLTARALTGSRGQYLHSLMSDAGVSEDYLVIKTLPFAMEGANQEEWGAALEATQAYRKEIFAALLGDSMPELILTDGAHAHGAMEVLLGQLREEGVLTAEENISWIRVNRMGEDHAAGLAEAYARIREEGVLGADLAEEFEPRMKRIPRAHLSYYARIWEGTSGDRVITAQDDFRGKAFAIVVPRWAYSQSSSLQTHVREAVESVLEEHQLQGFKMPTESLGEYLERRDIEEGLNRENLEEEVLGSAA